MLFIYSQTLTNTIITTLLCNIIFLCYTRLFEVTMLKKFGPAELSQHYAEFDTICDATQVYSLLLLFIVIIFWVVIFCIINYILYLSLSILPLYIYLFLYYRYHMWQSLFISSSLLLWFFYYHRYHIYNYNYTINPSRIRNVKMRCPIWWMTRSWISY